MGFISSFTGSAQRKDIRAGTEAATTQLTSGYDKAKGELNTGYDQAEETLQPYVEGGEKANKMYQDVIGINGADARTAAQNIYFSDDVLSQIRAQNLKRQGQVDNANGRYDSGTGALADSRVNLENYSGWEDRLKGESDKGGQYATTDAQLEAGRGSDAANLEYGYGQQRAGLETNQANAVAGSRGIGINNMLNAASVAVNAFTPTKSGTSPASNFASGLNKMFATS